MDECMQKTTIYLKAVSLKSISDVEELRKAIDDLYKYVQSSGGDIARLGEERVVITPPNVKIWKGIYELK
jgi:uncharacterized protein